MATSEYADLKESQKAQIDTMLGNLAIDCRSHTLEGLREMINNFVTINMTKVSYIKSRVHAFALQNAPAVVVTPPANPQSQNDTTGEGGGTTTTTTTVTTVNESTPTPSRLRVKKKITTKAELQSIINELTKLLDTVDENSPVEFNIND